LIDQHAGDRRDGGRVGRTEVVTVVAREQRHLRDPAGRFSRPFGVPDHHAMKIEWGFPANNGGAPIVNYFIKIYMNGSFWQEKTVTGSQYEILLQTVPFGQFEVHVEAFNGGYASDPCVASGWMKG
jgi:hypothetical protein